MNLLFLSAVLVEFAVAATRYTNGTLATNTTSSAGNSIASASASDSSFTSSLTSWTTLSASLSSSSSDDLAKWILNGLGEVESSTPDSLLQSTSSPVFSRSASNSNTNTGQLASASQSLSLAVINSTSVTSTSASDATTLSHASASILRPLPLAASSSNVSAARDTRESTTPDSSVASESASSATDSGDPLAKWIISGIGGGDESSTSVQSIDIVNSASGETVPSRGSSLSLPTHLSFSNNTTSAVSLATGSPELSTSASVASNGSISTLSTSKLSTRSGDTTQTKTTVAMRPTVTVGPTSSVLHANHSVQYNRTVTTRTGYQNYSSFSSDFMFFGNRTFIANCTVTESTAYESCNDMCMEYSSLCSSALSDWTLGATNSVSKDHVYTSTVTQTMTTYPLTASVTTIHYEDTTLRSYTYESMIYSHVTDSDGSVYRTAFSTTYAPGTHPVTSTYTLVDAEPLVIIQTVTRSYTRLSYSYQNPTAPEPPCELKECTACWADHCTIQGGEVELLYWPAVTQTVKTHTHDNGTESTFVQISEISYTEPLTVPFEDTTLVYPTVYVSFETAYATNDCGNTVGEAHAGAIVAVAPENLSSIRDNQGFKNRNNPISASTRPIGFYPVWEPAPFNFTHLDIEPVPVSVYLDQPNCWDHFCGNIYKQYRPYLSVPQEVYDLDTAWSTCDTFWSGLIDPPLALQQTDKIAGVTTPAGNDEPSATPKASLVEHTQPAEPSPTSAMPSNTQAPTDGTEHTVSPGGNNIPSTPSTPQQTGSTATDNPSNGVLPDNGQDATQKTTLGAGKDESGHEPDPGSNDNSVAQDTPAATPDDDSEDGDTTPSGGSDASRNGGNVNEPVTIPTTGRNEGDSGNENSPTPSNAADVLNEAQDQLTAPSPVQNTEGRPQNVPPPAAIFTGDDGREHTAVPAAAGGGIVIDDTTTAVPGATVAVPGNDPIVVEPEGIRQGSQGSLLPFTRPNEQDSQETRVVVSEGTTFTTAVPTPPAGSAPLSNVPANGPSQGSQQNAPPFVPGSEQAASTRRTITFDEQTYTVDVPGAVAVATPSSNGAPNPVVDLNGNVYTVRTSGASGAVLEGASTTVRLAPGETALLGGQTVELGQSENLIVNGDSLDLPAGSDDSNAVPQQAMVTAGSSVFTAQQAANAAVVEFGQGSLSVGGPATSIDGRVFSLAQGGLVVSGGQAPATTVPFSPPADEDAPRQAVVTLGSSTMTAQMADEANLVAFDQGSLSVGGAATTIDGAVVSLAPEGLMVSSQGAAATVTPFAPNPAKDDTSARQAVFTIGSSALTAQMADHPNVVALGQGSLSVGGSATTINGAVVSLAPKGLVISSKGAAATVIPFAPRPAEADTSAPQAVVTIGSTTFTAEAENNPSIVKFGSGSLSIGGPATTIDNVVVSLAQNGLAVSTNGQSSATTIPLSSAATPSEAVQAILTFGTSTLTAYQVANSPGLVVLDGTTLTADGHEVTISGTVVSLASTGIVVDSSSTIAFETITLDPTDTRASGLRASGLGAWTATPESLTQVAATLTLASEIVTAFQVAGSPGMVVVDGTTLSVGGEEVTINGVAVSAESDGVSIEGSLVAWSTATVDGSASEASGLWASSLGAWGSGVSATVSQTAGEASSDSDMPEETGVEAVDSGAVGGFEWSLLVSGGAAFFAVASLGWL
ncbi:hypothetical protein MBLNU230_g3171t1 [Neophaeotheca triangularis]